MRLGTKVLLLTLALVVGLTVAVLAIVRDRVRAQELVRTPAAIHRAVSEYFERVEAAAENARTVARLLFGEPGAKSVLSNLNQSGAAGENDPAAVQFRDYIFVETGSRELRATLASGASVAPAFHILFNERSDRLTSIAPGDPALDAAIRDPAIHWDLDPLIDGNARRTVRYALLAGDLFLVIGVPVSTSARADDPPTNAYFIGYRVDDAWATGFLRSEATETGNAALGVWFVRRDGERYVLGGDTSFGDPSKCVSAVFASGADLPLDAPPASMRIALPPVQTLLAEVVAYEPAPGQRMVLAVTASLDRALEPMERLLRTITLVGVGAVVVAFVACRWIAARIARPVKGLVSATGRIAEGDFNVALSTSRRDEIGEIARGLDSMARGLAQRDFIKDTFGKFVDPSVVAGLLEDPQRLRPGGEERVQTVLMSDLEGFTALAEALRPEQVVALLNEHLGASSDIVAELKGVVDKFIGDAVVAFWGPPLTDDHAHRAVVAAMKMVDAVRALAPRCAELGVPALRLRVGVSTGEMLVGNIGSASKFNYTVMGDAVNLCSRIEGLNKHYATGVLITDASAAALPREWTVREIDTVRVVGRATPVRVFEPLAAPDAPGDARQTAEALARAYSRALDHYCTRRFEDAAALFDECSRRFDDGAARAMCERARLFAVRPPPPDWDGAWSPGVK